MNEAAAVLGAGSMGHGIAEVLAREFETVWLYDPDLEKLKGAQKRISDSLLRLGKYGLITDQTAKLTLERIKTSSVIKQAVESASFIIEAAPENLQLKQDLLGSLDSISHADAIFATNTSSYTILEISKGVPKNRHSKIVGSHFFLPAQIVPLVEVSRGMLTSDDVFLKTFSLWLRCGKQPIKVNRDIPGYVGNRLQRALIREALALLAEGSATAEDIDLAVKMGFGVRYQVRGPLAQRDFAGLDLAATVQIDETDQERLKKGRQYLLDLVASGNLGLKTGQGLLNWEGENFDDLQKKDDDRLAQAVAMLGIKAK